MDERVIVQDGMTGEIVGSFVLDGDRITPGTVIEMGLEKFSEYFPAKEFKIIALDPQIIEELREK
jgi:hypothetical protein